MLIRSLGAQLAVPSYAAGRFPSRKLEGVSGNYDRYDYFDE
jgi:hypothetical protein